MKDHGKEFKIFVDQPTYNRLINGDLTLIHS
jgi:hypothetical protein